MKTELMWIILLILSWITIILEEIRAARLKRKNRRLEDSLQVMKILIPQTSKKTDLPYSQLHQYRTLVIKVGQQSDGFGFMIYTNDMRKMIINSWDTVDFGYKTPDEALILAQKYIDINCVLINENYGTNISPL